MSARPLDLGQNFDEDRTKFQGNARPISLSEKDISRFRSLISAPVKGMAKSAIGFGRMLPMFLQGPNLIPYLLTGVSAVPKMVEEPFQKGLEKGEKFIEEALPTEPEFAEHALERAGGVLLPGLAAVATGGASLLPTAGLSLAGGVLGQGIEEMGGGPLLQALAEGAPFAAPSLARKIIPSNADQTRILQMGRKFGMTEEQLAPLMPEVGKRRFFGKFAHTGESAQDILKGTREGVQNIYQTLETSPIAKNMVSQPSLNKFANDMQTLGQKMPYAIRSQLKNDAADLVKASMKKGGVSGEDLMNFYHDVSSRYNLGRTQLELFKQPIKEAISSINPQLGKDFETVNRMYQKSAQIGRILKPSQYEQIISLGEAYEAGAAVSTGDAGRLRRLLGIVGFRKLSEKMLTSPRLQNLIKKTQVAVEKNQLPLIKKFGDEFLREFKHEEED